MSNISETDNRFDSDTLAAAQTAYNINLTRPDDPVGAPEGWSWVQNFVDPDHSFQAAVFERVRDDGTTERMYAIAGTQDGTDVLIDSGLGRAQATTDAFRAMVADATRFAGSGMEITFAGHSLGGGLASIAAYHVQHALSPDKGQVREDGRQAAEIHLRSWNGFGVEEYIRAHAREDGVSFNPATAGLIDAIAYRTDADLISRIGTHIGRIFSITTDLAEPTEFSQIQSLSPLEIARRIASGFRVTLETAGAHFADTLREFIGDDGRFLINAISGESDDIRMLGGFVLEGFLQDPPPHGAAGELPTLAEIIADQPVQRAEAEGQVPAGQTGETTLLASSDATQPPSAAVPLSTRADLSAPPGQGEIRAGAGETVFSVADKMARKLGRSVTAVEIRALNALQTSGNNRFREGEAVRVPGPDGAGPGRGPGDAELADGVRVRDLGETQAHLLENKLGRSLREIAQDPALRKQARALFEDGFVEPAGADGLPRALGRKLAMIAAGDGPKAAAKTLQQAANRLGARLRPDGVAGPRTRSAVDDLLGTAGEGALEEAVALSRFHGLAGDLVDGPGDPDGPGRAFDVSLGTLFPKRRAGKPSKEVRVLQEATNDASRFAGRKPDLRIDGIFGPRTAAAMTDAIRARGPDDFTDDLAGRFGFPGAAARGKPARGRLPRSF